MEYYFPCGNAAGGNLFATIPIENSIKNKILFRAV